MLKVKRVLISVSDKTGLVDFVKGLQAFDVEILSTGGTAKMLRAAGFSVKDVSEHTGFPEMLDGRVKTLHPAIHGGLLALRDNPEHLKQIAAQHISLIDMVVINLYPFAKVIQKKNVHLEEAIENIDIGGPSMLRSAAKNFKHVAVVCNPERYETVLKELNNNSGILPDRLLFSLGVEAFEHTSRYDNIIYNFLNSRLQGGDLSSLPKNLSLHFLKAQDLRYGENPHQMAAFYRDAAETIGLANMKQLNGKELSYNNILDLNSGIDCIKDFENPTAVIIKHNNPTGLAEDKECLTVLDFIGQANKKYNFENKFEALLSDTNRSVTREIKDDFISVPKGCYIQLEKVASRYILENIRASYGNRAGLVARIATFSEDTGLDLTLSNFLEYYHMNPRSIYKYAAFSRLCVQADVKDDFIEPLEETMKGAFNRFSSVDSRRWIDFLVRLLTENDLTLTQAEQRMLQMFQFTVWQKPFEECGFASILDGVLEMKRNPFMCAELVELLKYNYSRIDFIDQPVDLGFDSPLDLHCTYTRDQLLVALDFLKPSTVREGVKWLSDKKLDVLLITLNKSDKDYSPTTMYNDYSIDDVLFHWQSQSTTSENSPTGKRYIGHRQNGSKVLLFVREFKNDSTNGLAAAYTYLGTANYVRHDGSKPMNITWKLNEPIPAKFLKKTNKLVVG